MVDLEEIVNSYSVWCELSDEVQDPFMTKARELDQLREVRNHEDPKGHEEHEEFLCTNSSS